MAKIIRGNASAIRPSRAKIIFKCDDCPMMIIRNRITCMKTDKTMSDEEVEDFPDWCPLEEAEDGKDI